MDTPILTDKTLENPRNQRLRYSKSKTDVCIHIQASCLKELFRKSLRALAHKLKNGICNASSHSDCTMKVQVMATDSKVLLKEFLLQVLTLTHAQRTIFCTMYVVELTETKLVAQLYGRWFATFCNDFKTISKHSLSMETEEEFPWKTVISFER